MLDHSALMSLARMMMEAMSMHGYLSEPVSDDQWELRNLVLRLHDTENRINYVRTAAAAAGLDDLLRGREELRAALASNAAFGMLDQERQARIMRGGEMFVVGMRKVAKLAVGWDSDIFNALYSYFSAHSHSSPMSFIRMKEHGVDYFLPSDAQFDMAKLAITVATGCLRRVTLRHLDSSPTKIDRFSQAVVDNLRRDDREATFFAPAAQAASSDRTGRTS
jgi:hypothetical protein